MKQYFEMVLTPDLQLLSGVPAGPSGTITFEPQWIVADAPRIEAAKADAALNETITRLVTKLRDTTESQSEHADCVSVLERIGGV